MKKMKYLRTWLVVALVVTIIGSLTGGTVAWFTDSVESTGNVIETGTLDVKLYAANKRAYDTDGFNWTEHEIKDGSDPLFNYDKWEPGYTDVKYVKIENAGNLAFKYSLNVKPAMSPDLFSEESTLLADTITLAKNIDVYVADAQKYETFNDLKKAAGKNVYNLFDLFAASMNIVVDETGEIVVDETGKIKPGNETDGAVHGVMLPATAVADENAPSFVEKVIALHMKEKSWQRMPGFVHQ